MRDLPGGFPRCGLPAPAPPRSRTHGNWTTKPAMGTVGAGVALWRGRDTEARRGGGNDRCGGGSELETRVGAQAYLLEVRTATYGRARRSVCGHRLTPPHTHTHTQPLRCRLRAARQPCACPPGSRLSSTEGAGLREKGPILRPRRETCGLSLEQLVVPDSRTKPRTMRRVRELEESSERAPGGRDGTRRTAR